MKLFILILFLAISCQLTIAQFNFGDMFGKTVDQLGSVMQNVLNIGKKPTEISNKSDRNAANSNVGTITTTATVAVTTIATSPSTVISTTPQSIINDGTTTGGTTRSDGGLGGFLLNNIGNVAQTMGKIAENAIGTITQGPLNPLNSLPQAAIPTIGTNPLTNLASSTAGASPLINLVSPATGANPLTNLASSTIGAVTNGMSAFSQFVNTTAGVLNMVQNQANLMNGIIEQFQNLSSNLFGNFDRIMQQLQNITAVLSPDLSALAPFLPIIREFLNFTETSAKNVIKDVNKRLISTISRTAGTILNQTNDLQVWAAQQRTKLDGSPKKSEGEKIIDDFVAESVTKIETCVNATNTPIQQAYNYTREFVDEASKLGNHVVDQFQNCLGGQKLLFIRIIECVQNGTETISKATVFIVQEVLPIQNRIGSVSLRAAIDWSCIVTEVFSIGSSKPVIEQRINRLIR